MEKSKVRRDIIEEIGVIAEYDNGWRKELNLISWNGRAPKYDIRDWDEGHVNMGKGTTLSLDEAKTLRDLLGWIDE